MKQGATELLAELTVHHTIPAGGLHTRAALTYLHLPLGTALINVPHPHVWLMLFRCTRMLNIWRATDDAQQEGGDDARQGRITTKCRLTRARLW